MQKINCNESTAARIGMRAALLILKKWNCNQQQIQALLKLPEKYNNLDIEKVNFSQDQVERISYILNIHAGLSVLFSNPENIYGFMNMVNHNEPFNGTRPIDVICNEKINHLKMVMVHIDQLVIL
ncbi:hypothetical protein FJD32_007680 [Shewanella sp. LC6]|jgi:hypothetical protein|uniref:hypothetical protein n=1 Tax=Shewanella TaxID=22 RepID=UPI000B51A671|nr:MULTISPECIES: hypothetical protein [Shewanella]ASF13730.1 hypothetical protein CEQ32_00805 [Shewanella sp. FDAARGOS_354]QQK59400.1 hypothetical protein FJD32_007680 [Shewanella sp. LC6]TPE51606.1 hypothetical protein FJD33_18790 [Shewanella sp. LC2]BDA59959.1 DUF2384 domain-containing protein [Shewanella xiamenensis]